MAERDECSHQNWPRETHVRAPRQVVDDYCPPESGEEIVDGWPTMFECEKVRKGTYVTLEKRTQGGSCM